MDRQRILWDSGTNIFGEVFVAEAGYPFYGTSPEEAPPARILRLKPDGSSEVVYDQNVPLAAIRDYKSSNDMPEGIIPPLTGVTFSPNDGLYVAHRTCVSTLGPETGEVNLTPYSSGTRVFVFNPPALLRVHYAHHGTREEAEAALRYLCEALDAGKTAIIALHNMTFAVPAHSVHYVALGKARRSA